MKVETVSFYTRMSKVKRVKNVTDIINSSDADLIMFGGHTLKSIEDIYYLENSIKNTKTTVLFEVHKINESGFLKLRNCLYFIKNGLIQNMFTHQFFSTSGEIDDNESLCERYINELETRRIFEVGDMKCLVILCGENNIIRNIQTEHNRPVFRLPQRKDLENRFFNILNSVDIVLNPMHSPMGNQGKVEQRRILLSNKNRFYFSVSDINNREKIGLRGLQYSFYNGQSIKEDNIIIDDDKQIRQFLIGI